MILGREAQSCRASRRKRRRALAVVLLSFLAVEVGCGGRECPDWNKVLKDDPVAQSKREIPPAPPKTAEDLIVYLDTSSSMAGYVSPDKQKATVFSRALQELRNFSTTVSPPLSVYVRRVDAEVGARLNDTFLSEASIKRATYNGSETNLSGAIETFGRGARAVRETRENVASAADKQSDSEAGKGEEEPPPARFHVLVTDGVQSTRQRGDGSCVAGSDQICVRKKILALLDNGWGAYVIGLRSEFKGNIYSEINRAVIPYESRERDPQSYRPFYLYIFSPDRTALDELVAALQARLRPLAGHDDGMRVLALTSAYADGWGKGALQIPKTNASPLEGNKAEEEGPSRLTLKVSLDTEKTGAKPFSVEAAIGWLNNVKSGGSPGEMASLLKWNLVSVYPSGGASAEKGVRLPEVKLVGAEPQPDGSVKVEMTAQWPRANGTPQCRVYRLEGRLNLEQQTPPWIKQWSTELDTTQETGNRTLFLESALLGLWHNPGLERQVISEVYLRVGPK